MTQVAAVNWLVYAKVALSSERAEASSPSPDPKAFKDSHGSMGSLLLQVLLVSELPTVTSLKLGLAVEELSCGTETRKDIKRVKCHGQLTM